MYAPNADPVWGSPGGLTARGVLPDPGAPWAPPWIRRASAIIRAIGVRSLFTVSAFLGWKEGLGRSSEGLEVREDTRPLLDSASPLAAFLGGALPTRSPT